jgi:hypothetical protein
MKRKRRNNRRMFRVTAVADRRPQLERLTGMPIGAPGSEQRMQMAALIVANYLGVVGVGDQITDAELMALMLDTVPLKMYQELVISPQCSDCGTIPSPFRNRHNQPLCDRCILNDYSNQEPVSSCRNS